jgi:hypothetical protein
MQQRADGPTRRSSSLSRGVLDRATANSLAADHHGPLQDDQAVKTKLLTGSCLRGLDQGLGLARARCSRTGRLNRSAPRLGWLKGGLDIPAIYAECPSLPREHPRRTLTRSAWSRAGESNNVIVIHIARSFEKTRCPWLLSRLNEALTLAPFPSGMVGRFPEAPISRSSRKAGLSDGYGSCSTTSGPRLLMGRCPSSTGAQHGSSSCSVQHNARAPGHKVLPEQADQNQRLLATASPVFHVLHRVLGSCAHQNGA